MTEDRLKVLLVATEWPPTIGGGGSHSYYLAEGLLNCGIDLWIVSSKQASPLIPSKLDPDRFLQLDLDEFTACRPPSTNAWKQLAQFVLSIGTLDVIHGHHYQGYHLSWMIRAILSKHGCRPKFVVTLHKTPPPMETPDFSMDPGFAFVYAISNSDPPDVLVANSNSFHKLLLSTQTKAARIRSIMHGVPTDFFASGAQQERPVKFEYVLCPVRVDPRKNLEDAIHGWKQACAPQGVHLIITGTPRGRSPEVRDIVQRLKYRAGKYKGLLHFGDPRRSHRNRMIPFTDMPRFLAYSASCLFPSTSEGFGLAGLEALAAGAPLIAGDNDGVRQFVRNGHNAILLAREKTKRRQQLAKHLSDLLAGKAVRQKLVKQGKKTATEFSADRMAEQHVEAYHEDGF